MAMLRQRIGDRMLWRCDVATPLCLAHTLAGQPLAMMFHQLWLGPGSWARLLVKVMGQVADKDGINRFLAPLVGLKWSARSTSNRNPRGHRNQWGM